MAVTDIAVRRRARRFNDWLTHKVHSMFEQRVLPIIQDITLKWRLLVEEGCRHGHMFSQPDLIIDAAARHDGLTIARDIAEHVEAGVTVVNPWLDPPTRPR